MGSQAERGNQKSTAFHKYGATCTVAPASLPANHKRPAQRPVLPEEGSGYRHR